MNQAELVAYSRLTGGHLVRPFRSVYSGTPRPQARARHGQGYTFTESGTREAQGNLHAWLLQEVRLGGDWDYWPNKDVPLALAVTFRFAVPASWPKWRRERALTDIWSHTSKPDLDNLVKLVKDAANGALWADDSAVAQVEARKVYGERAETVIEVRQLPAQPKTRPR